MTRNIKCEISYDGTDFHGFQIQPNHRTVQGELEQALYRLTNQQTKMIASGRTDAGVHARKQVCHFLTNSKIPEEKWIFALNALLPDDVLVTHAEEAAFNFHARFDVKKKIYRYYIDHGVIANVFRRRYSWHYPYALDIEVMKEASQMFIGEHDFTAFSSAKTEVENKIRTIYDAKLWQDQNEIIFEIAGSGFLYNMVRIMIGTLVEVGRKKMNQTDISDLFYKKERALAGITAPAHGLILWDVVY